MLNTNNNNKQFKVSDEWEVEFIYGLSQNDFSLNVYNQVAQKLWLPFL